MKRQVLQPLSKFTKKLDVSIEHSFGDLRGFLAAAFLAAFFPLLDLESFDLGFPGATEGAFMGLSRWAVIGGYEDAALMHGNDRTWGYNKLIDIQRACPSREGSSSIHPTSCT